MGEKPIDKKGAEKAKVNRNIQTPAAIVLIPKELDQFVGYAWDDDTFMAIFQRGKRESDEKRLPREDGLPFPLTFGLTKSSLSTRLAVLEKNGEPREQTIRALRDWPPDPSGITTQRVGLDPTLGAIREKVK